MGQKGFLQLLSNKVVNVDDLQRHLGESHRKPHFVNIRPKHLARTVVRFGSVAADAMAFAPALEVFNSKWKNVKGILENLENLFICEVCGSPVNNPCTLGGCEHFFCKTCIEDATGNKCPICQIPSHAKDVQPNRQIANAVAICSKIKKLVNATGEGNSNDFQLTPERSSTREAPGSSVYLEYSLPQWGAQPTSPISSRTRRLDTKKAPTRTPNSGQAGHSGNRKSKGPKVKQAKTTKKTSNQKKSGCPSNTNSGDETSGDDDDEIAENQTMSGVRRKMVRKTKQKQWTSGDGQDEEKENSITPRTTNRKSSKEASHPSTSATKRQQIISSELDRTPVQSSRRASVTSVASTSTERRRRQSGASASLPLTPTVQSTPRSRSLVASPATPSSRVKKNAKGETPLHVAAIKGDLQRVQELLLDGASPNVKDNAGWTPLHEAVNHGFVEIASLLIDHGALINVPGMDNDTPLHDAVVNDRMECVKLLVSKGANTMARNIYGRTPVDAATNADMKALLKATAVPTDQQEDETEDVIEIHQVVVLATGLSREQKIKLQKCCSLLHWKLVEDFLPEVTHVVTSVNKDGMCPRTMKYLHAILNGKWIVNFEWVEMCIDFKQRVCEEAFEVPGTSTCPDSHAPQRARKNFQKQCPGLLDGCHFYLQGEFNYPIPEKDELQKLIKCGGGRLLTREIKSDMLDESQVIIPYHADKNSTVSHFIVHDRKNVEPYLISPRLASVPVSWLLDSIAEFKLIPVLT